MLVEANARELIDHDKWRCELVKSHEIEAKWVLIRRRGHWLRDAVNLDAVSWEKTNVYAK